MITKTEKSDFNTFYDAIVDEHVNTTIAAEGLSSAESSGTIDTGCYILNALVSGSIYGGMPNNKITALAGDSATGKTFIALGIVRSFLDRDKKAFVVYYDTEAAVTKAAMEERGIDTTRVILPEIDTVEKLRTNCMKMLDRYIDKNIEAPMLIVLDSLGMLSSVSEIGDAQKGEVKADPGRRAQIIKGTFRTITLKLGRAGVPFLLTNHTYDSPNMYAAKQISGGSGLKYAASSIVMLNKSKDKDDKEVVGIKIRATNVKARPGCGKENAECIMKLNYKTGLDKYFGLLELGEKHKVIKRSGAYYQLPDGTKAYAKVILESPKKYFTDELMKQLDKAAAKEYTYGG